MEEIEKQKYKRPVPQRIVQEYHPDNAVILLSAFAPDPMYSKYYTTRFAGGSYGSNHYYYSGYSGYDVNEHKKGGEESGAGYTRLANYYEHQFK